MGVKSATAFGLSSGLEPGMVLLNTQTFSAVSSVSLPANTFNATYDNYVVSFYTTANSNANFQMRLRSSGTDATTAAYDRAGMTATSNAGPASFFAQAETTSILAALGSNNRFSTTIDIFLPFQTQYTSWIASSVSINGPTPYLRLDHVAADYGVIASYDSATFYPSSGTITGSLSVFGVNK